MLRHDLLAAERDDDYGADIGMAAVRRQRFVSDRQIGAELTAAGQVRQRRPDRRNRPSDPFGNDRGADDRWYDEHVIAYADATVGTAIAEKLALRAHRSS